MILTELFTGKFLCLVKTTPEKLVKQFEDYRGLLALAEIMPKLNDIGLFDGVGVVLTPLNSGGVGEVTTHWSIDIFGDAGMVELILTKNPTEWS